MMEPDEMQRQPEDHSIPVMATGARIAYQTAKVQHQDDSIDILHCNLSIVTGQYLDITRAKQAPVQQGFPLTTTFVNDEAGWNAIPSPGAPTAALLPKPPVLYDKPIPGQVVPGTREALKSLLLENECSHMDTGVSLCPQKFGSKFGYYDKGTSYKKLCGIGQGKFGKVSLIKDKTSGALIAKKKFHSRRK